MNIDQPHSVVPCIVLLSRTTRSLRQDLSSFSSPSHAPSPPLLFLLFLVISPLVALAPVTRQTTDSIYDRLYLDVI